MKTLFIDCGTQLEKVFRRVHRADDPAVILNLHPFQSGDLPLVQFGLRAWRALRRQRLDPARGPCPAPCSCRLL